jgi:hypothetical protein
MRRTLSQTDLSFEAQDSDLASQPVSNRKNRRKTRSYAAHALH